MVWLWSFLVAAFCLIFFLFIFYFSIFLCDFARICRLAAAASRIEVFFFPPVAAAASRAICPLATVAVETDKVASPVGVWTDLLLTQVGKMEKKRGKGITPNSVVTWWRASAPTD